jgi:hypothetical protein
VTANWIREKTAKKGGTSLRAFQKVMFNRWSATEQNAKVLWPYSLIRNAET